MITLAKKLFRNHEILLKENFYLFFDRKKIVTFIPLDYTDILTTKMSQAGAGRIGNYEMCSFRTKGTGTFKPGLKSTPYSGKKRKLSYEQEYKLEMECNYFDLNIVIDVLLKSHPYEEVAYEVYDFKKRDKKQCGVVIELKNKITLKEFLKRLNRNIDIEAISREDEFSRIAITGMDVKKDVLASARFVSCEYLLFTGKSIYKLHKI